MSADGNEGFHGSDWSMRGSSQSIWVQIRTPDTFSTTWRRFGLKVVLGALGAQLEPRMRTSECQRSDFCFRYRRSADNSLISVYRGRGVQCGENQDSGHSKHSPNTSGRLERRLPSGQMFLGTISIHGGQILTFFLLSAEQAS